MKNNIKKPCLLRQASAFLVFALGVVAVASAPLCAQDPDVNVLTWGYDGGKTQQNLNEATLTTAALQSTTNKFGQLCNISVDGQVYSQPLVVSDVRFNGVTTPYTSVVYVVTQNDTVYAINGTAQGTSPTTCTAATIGQVLGSTTLQTYNINGTPTTLYQVDCGFIGAQNGQCVTIKPYVGILGTPVISLSGVGVGTIYLVTENQDMPIGTMPNNWYHWLHALDITTLAEKAGYPVRVYPPAYASNPSVFSEKHIQRPGLLFSAPAQSSLTRYTLCTGAGAIDPISTSCGTPIPATDSTGTAVHFKNGATPVISAASSTATDAVVWAIWQDGAAEDAMMLGPPPTTGILYAFDAGATGSSMTQLYTSNNTCAADEMAPATKFSLPTVANAYVYVGGQSPNTKQNNTGLGTFYIFGLGRTGC